MPGDALLALTCSSQVVEKRYREPCRCWATDLHGPISYWGSRCRKEVDRENGLSSESRKLPSAKSGAAGSQLGTLSGKKRAKHMKKAAALTPSPKPP